MTSADDMVAVIDQGFTFAQKFDDSQSALRYYKDLLKMCGKLSDDEIEEVGESIIGRLREAQVVEASSALMRRYPK